MQFVAPAQILLVLWLLAATAPAATVLINGSLSALIESQADDGQTQQRRTLNERSQATREEKVSEADADDVASILPPVSSSIAWYCDRLFVASRPTEAHESPPTDVHRRTVSFALLHTDLQRHRPKAA